MTLKSAASLLAIACAFPLPALAQEGDNGIDSDSAGFGSIVVTAARTQLPASALPITVDIIDSEALDRQLVISGSTVDAISALLPSFSPTREKLSGAGESLRGRSPLYAINGIPQSTPVRDGSRDGYTIDPFFVDRVEIIYGSNALQGIGATGGVVNQVTVAAPRTDGLALRTLLQATAADDFAGETLGGKAGVLAGWRTGAFDASAGASFERRGAFVDGSGNRIGVDGTQGEIQDSDSWSIFARIGYDLSSTARFEVLANRFELEGNGHYVLVPGNRATGVFASSERGESQGALPSNRAELLSASLTETDLAGGNFALQGFYSRTRDVFGGGVFGTFQDPAIDPSRQLFDQSANRSRKLGGKLSYERAVPGFDDLVVTAGFDALFDETEQLLVQTGRTWVPLTEFRSLAPFVQGNLALADGLFRLAGGVRYENVQLSVGDFTTLASYGSRRVAGGSPSFDRALLNGGAIFEPVAGVRAYGSYAEGYTIADVGRILRGISSEGVDIDSFLALEPVVSNNRELGVEVERGPLVAGASYYWSDSDLGQLLVPNADGIFEVLRQPISIEGLELSIATQTPVPGLTLSTAYSHTSGSTDDDGDGILESDLDGANISPDRMNLAADFARGGFRARAQARIYFARDFAGQDPRNDFAGYTLLDAYVAQRLGIGELALGVQNLTDETYVSYYSDTQRPADGNRFFSGRGRTITLSWQADF